MNKLAELRKKLADLKGKGLAVLDGADREARDWLVRTRCETNISG